MRKKTINIDITKEVENYFNNKYINIKNKTLMIALSSGIDSSVLFDVLLKLKDKLCFNIKIAHVNYNLRGDDSIKDKEFIEKIANKNSIDTSIKEIAYNSYKNKNIQNEARIDRYNFFEELYNKKLFDYLIIAQHKDDLIETIIYRILKGSGGSVYKAMKDKTGYIMRPLINVYREDIEKYAKENRVEYREDISNKNNKYKRNKIRNVILPLLNDINNKSKDNILKFVKIAYEESRYINRKSIKLYKNILVEKNKIDLDYLDKYNNTIKNILIKKFLFNNKIDITSKRIDEVKKIISSKKNHIIARFDSLYIIKKYNILSIEKNIIEPDKEGRVIHIEKDGVYNFYGRNIIVEKTSIASVDIKDNEKLYISTNYPITIESKKHCDIIIDNYTGTKLKLKKLFIDNKIKKEYRECIPIVKKENKIIAICFGLFDKTKKNRISKEAYIENKNDAISIYFSNT